MPSRRTVPDPPVIRAPGAQGLMYAATTATVVFTLAVALFSGVLWEWSEGIANDLMTPSTYIDEVLR